ncbi:MAG: SPFH domain-containing protein [Ruminococcus sp.]|nr:SPFH domain-containing protein [Ruminococcus sp.]
MGLIHAALASFSSTLADSWLEYFVCDSIPADTLVVKGVKKTSKHSSNTKGSENVITEGSGIVVHEGQAAIITDSGVVIEIATAPGCYTYDSSQPSSFFSGNFGQGVKDTFKEMWDRIKHGGDVARDQRVYYFNTKEIIGNKFGTQNPVPFRVTYEDIGRAFTVGVRCNGIYSYKITDPSAFYLNISGNFSGSYSRSELDEQLKSEFLNNLQPAFAKLSNSIRYDELPGHTIELTDAMNEALTGLWKQKRGLEVASVAINSVTISKEDEDRIKKFEDTAWNRDAGNAAATMVAAQAEAMQNAASNQGGAAMGFFGMGMAQQAGGFNAQELFNMSAQQKAAAAAAAPAAPAPSAAPGAASAAASWVCSCGTSNTGKFCENCGKPRPSADGWTCSCGAVNKGKFCSECGKPKPAGAPLYKCDKCGWEPADPFNPPKFCAECGDPFTDDDIVS